MHTFANKPKATQLITSAKDSIPLPVHRGRNSEVHSILHSHRSTENPAVQLSEHSSMSEPYHDETMEQLHQSVICIQRLPEVSSTGTSPVIIPSDLISSMSTRILRATGRMNLAGTGTFGPGLAAVLQNLSSVITYRDVNHQDHNGQELEVVLRRRGDGPQSTPRIFRVRLVLDDKDNPIERAYFEPQGESGNIVLNIKPQRGSAGETGAAGQRIDALSDDDLANILYHEGVHMLRHWQETYGEDYLPFTGLEHAALSLSLFTDEIAGIESELRTIFTVVNAARSGNSPVPDSSAHDFAMRLAEEAMVRGETQFMEAMRNRRESAGSSVMGGIPQISGAVGRTTVSTYLFDFGDMLEPRDRDAVTASTEEARPAAEALARITVIFNGIIQEYSEVRFGGYEDIPVYP